MRERRRRCPLPGELQAPATHRKFASPSDRHHGLAAAGAAKPSSSLGQITPSTCAQTATIAMNKAIEASAPASSTTARTMMLPHFSWNEKGT